MKRWNGITQSIRYVDRSLAGEEATGAARCLACNRSLPLGVQRAFCVEHSPYPQQVLRELQGAGSW